MLEHVDRLDFYSALRGELLPPLGKGLLFSARLADKVVLNG
jgi:hypothetical protein